LVGAGDWYFGGIVADVDGGFILHDSANGPVLHRISAQHQCWQTLRISGANGQPFRLYDAVAVDPSGRVWTSDRHHLFRHDESGKAVEVLGGPAPNSMNPPVAVALDRQGNVYAVEKATALVHVFDRHGAPIKILAPDPGTMSSDDALPWIAVDPDGAVR